MAKGNAIPVAFAVMLSMTGATSTASAATCTETIAPSETVTVPAGPFVMGSSQEEREMAYRLDEAAYGHSVTRDRRWYDAEDLRTVDLPEYRIMKTPVTNADYAMFVACTEHRPPDVTRQLWDSYDLIHPFERTAPYRWNGVETPADREEHPVVLVSYLDANAYAVWLSDLTGQKWRLPSEAEWEKAARGTDGRAFPWGDDFDPDKLNSHDAGPFGTVPVGSYPNAVSPYGLLDAAGQVFEWTSTPGREGRHIVKGGSWDDKGCGVCRPAARHSRPDDIKHILVGFRLVLEE
ncbi:formylglycine-generating enzyme family protein [Hoeflea sp. WL0058]|uniref:Formylglycine-generating enzyme family protein n=1 Tax=Flavimaribacter sediminis TaxID=2865987 RepID=A0AAE2ZJF7_9HYPH|nr:SUMF1/EgtB/PvdO family nonheme iron enzyme [Flavimaribacter sediminis]MBW8637094.1 formylglycine-generating enzyme family protein [Flavimaribacter sediminis]